MKRLLIHIPVGIITGAFTWLNPAAGLLFGAGFIAYEVTQGGDPHRDIKGWLWGLGVAGAWWFFFAVIGSAPP